MISKLVYPPEWRSGGVCTIGIVVYENEFGKQRGYIGVHCWGNSEDEDAEYIRDWGVKLSFAEAKGFFPKLDEKKYGNV